MEKKAETKALIEQEVSSIRSSGKQPLAKITRAEITVILFIANLKDIL